MRHEDNHLGASNNVCNPHFLLPQHYQRIQDPLIHVFQAKEACCLVTCREKYHEGRIRFLFSGKDDAQHIECWKIERAIKYYIK
ncbi:hypothetical protein GOP47_0029184 [Adiantum capillus-veneris]|nr:hypothetical protein GOP47_0029184 [Adiantum capillus-veneris]